MDSEPSLRGKMIRRCTKEALWCVIYGCPNLHINERVICQDHSGDWYNLILQGGAWCGHIECGEKVADFEVTRVRDLTAGFALAMRVRQ
jgi:hypothetical protein